MTTLCLDFGNTRLKAAVFNYDKMEKELLLKDDSKESIQSLINEYQPTKSILSSVIDHNIEIEILLAQNTKFHKLSHLTKLAFTCAVGKPETIGADRLALAAAAVHFYPGKNNLVIGLGSCITFNFINNQHELIGGSISPGLEMRLKALNYYTARLPLVNASWNVPLIGYDTETNIQSGVVLGMAKEIDGIIAAYAEKYDNFNVLLTGGDLVFFCCPP